MADLFTKEEKDGLAPSKEERDQIFRYATELDLLRKGVEFVHAKVIRLDGEKKFFFDVFFNPSMGYGALGDECLLSIDIRIEDDGVFGVLTLYDPLTEHKDKGTDYHVIASSHGKIPYNEFISVVENAQSIALLISRKNRANWHKLFVFQEIKKTLKYDENVVPKIK